jgi:hypothetical protein
MNNQLATVQPMNDLMQVAKMFAESGMFETTKTQAQAVVKILAGQEIGIPAFAAISGIHIIKGKPTIGAGIIASCVKGSGKYDYKVKEMTDKTCSIDFYQGSEMIGNSTFTIEDAKKAETQNITKFPRNMLFARAISNGVKWYCPDVFKGPVYTPEEMNSVTEDIPHTIVEPAAELPTPPNTPAPSKKVPFKNFNKALSLIKDGVAGFIEETEAKYEFTEEQKNLWENEKIRVQNEVLNAEQQPA